MYWANRTFSDILTDYHFQFFGPELTECTPSLVFSVGKRSAPAVIATDVPPNYDMFAPWTSWIGISQQFLDRLYELLERKIVPKTFFLLIDHFDQHLVIIPGKDALGTMFKRDRKGANIHHSFNVKKTGGGYSVQTRQSEPDIRVHHIDTLGPLVDLIQKN
jgi:hypothetical protein